MFGKERSTAVYVDVADTDKDVFTIPALVIGKLLRVGVRNPTATDARIRLWDKFTDFEGTGHSMKKFDHIVSAGTSKIFELNGDRQVIGKLVAQSTVAGVDVNVSVRFE